MYAVVKMRIFLFGSGERALVENRDLIQNPLSVFGVGEGGFRETVPFTVRYKFIVEREELCSGFRVEYKFLKGIGVGHFAYSEFWNMTFSSYKSGFRRRSVISHWLEISRVHASSGNAFCSASSLFWSV